MQRRWGAEASAVFVAVTLVASLMIHERPWELAELALPPALVLAGTIALWPSIARSSGGGDSWGMLLLTTLFIGPIALLASCAYLVLRTGAWSEDPGEHGGALLFMLAFTSAVPSFIGLPAALLLPRVLDPVLWPRRLKSAG